MIDASAIFIAVKCPYSRETRFYRWLFFPDFVVLSIFHNIVHVY